MTIFDFLGIIFDNFYNFQQRWRFLTIFNNIDNFWQSCRSLTIFTIFDNIYKFWQFWPFLQFLCKLASKMNDKSVSSANQILPGFVQCIFGWHQISIFWRFRYYQHLRFQHSLFDPNPLIGCCVLFCRNNPTLVSGGVPLINLPHLSPSLTLNCTQGGWSKGLYALRNLSRSWIDTNFPDFSSVKILKNGITDACSTADYCPLLTIWPRCCSRHASDDVIIIGVKKEERDDNWVTQWITHLFSIFSNVLLTEVRNQCS